MPDDLRAVEGGQQVNLQNLDREIRVRADSVDEEARTVEVTFTTGAAVPRYMPGYGRVMEELDVSEKAISLDRLNDGAPFLDSHNRWELGNIIGVVERAWIDGKEGRALIRISDRDSVEPIWRDIKGGIIRNVSVGYRVHRYEMIENEGAPPRVIAREWEPFEISAVPIGADAKAGFRAADNGDTENPCIIERAEPANTQKEHEMTTKAIKQGDAPTGDAKTPSTPDDINKRDIETPAPAQPAPPAPQDGQRDVSTAIAAERQRVADISDLCRQFDVDDAKASEFVRNGDTVENVRKAVLDILAEKDGRGGEVRARIGRDEVDTRRSLVESALIHRVDPSAELVDGAREYRGMSLMEIGKDLLAARGLRVRGMGKSEVSREILSRAHSTSDFPFILANVANKRMRSAYQAAPQTFKPIVNATTLPDFKTTSVIAMGDAPSFLRKYEGAEYKLGTTSESREQYALATYGRKLAFTREMLINDDMEAFSRIVRMFGTAAANLESDMVWGLVTGNPDLSDSTAVFHADHGNLATAGAITVANLGLARALMRKQKALAPSATEEGSTLNIEPAYLVVPAELETVALQYTRQTSVVTDPANQNVWAGSMQPIIEPRLASLSGGSADDWYLFANPAAIDIIDIAYLEGEQGPQVFQTENFDTDGLEFKGRLDFAAAWIDHRGAVKNPGS